MNLCLPVPPLPDLTAARDAQEIQAAELARWLWNNWQSWDQATIAALLNEHGFRSRRGNPYTQPMVSLLIRRAA
jgi:hypothetical protein